jgi:uncharacterized membrane protein
MATHRLARAIGVPRRHSGLMRAMGVREFGVGLAVLTEPRESRWMWGRVAGDALDLGLLGLACVDGRRRERARLMAAIAAVVGVTALDVLCARYNDRHGYRISSRKLSDSRGLRIQKSLGINAPAAQIYSFCREPNNLPKIVPDVSSILSFEKNHLRFSVDGLASKRVTWDLEVIEERPNELISWRSVGSTRPENAGSIRFIERPRERGTIVR